MLSGEKLFEPGGAVDVDKTYSKGNHGEITGVDSVGVVGGRFGQVGGGGVG